MTQAIDNQNNRRTFIIQKITNCGNSNSEEQKIYKQGAMGKKKNQMISPSNKNGKASTSNNGECILKIYEIRDQKIEIKAQKKTKEEGQDTKTI